MPTLAERRRIFEVNPQFYPVTGPALGAYVDSVDGVGAHIDYLDTFNTTQGYNCRVVFWYVHWLTAGDAAVPFSATLPDLVYARNAIPEIVWNPDKIGAGANQPAFSCPNITAGNFDAFIAAWAAAAAAWGKPFFLRFAHEMNSNFYSWGTAPTNPTGNTPAQFIAMWRHVHDIFVAQGATKALWVWCPNNRGSVPANESTQESNYPGDAYVDWIAFDAYNYGTDGGLGWVPSRWLFDQNYANLGTISNKPMMIAEMACSENGGNKATWITGMMADFPTRYPKIKQVRWFDADRHLDAGQSDFRIESSAGATTAWKNAAAAAYWVNPRPQYKPASVAVPVPATAVPTNGLIAEYRFTDGAGQVLTDFSGLGNHAQLGSAAGSDTNDPTWVASGLSFGANDYCVLPAGAIPTGTGITVVAAAQSPATDNHCLVDLRFNTATDTRIGNYWAGNRNNLWVKGNSGAIYPGGGHEGGSPWPASTWACTAWSVDRSAGTGDIYSTLLSTFWRDWDFAGGNTAWTDGTRSGYIGTRWDATAYFWGGLVGYVCIYNRILTPDELMQAYQAITTAMAARGVSLG